MLEGKVPALAHLNRGGKLVTKTTGVSVGTLFTELPSVPGVFLVLNVPRKLDPVKPRPGGSVISVNLISCNNSRKSFSYGDTGIDLDLHSATRDNVGDFFQSA